MCSNCGYSGVGSCQEVFAELSFYTLAQPRPPFIHQLAVDAYAAQHLDDSMSPIQRLFGLMGLCLVCEHGATGYDVQMAHMAKSKDTKRADWPLLEVRHLSFPTNIGDVLAADDRDAAIRQWVETTWAAYEYAHPLIRQFCSELV
ncbi:MAG: hypothetical protein GC165_11395 [Armatimonadetes bacterium]|nr:hypothetical protein [Armatimonadota bacterium]